MRATSNVCGLKSIEKQKKNDAKFIPDVDRLYREEYLKGRFGEYEEYDVKASVPRVSRAMIHNGDTGNSREDLYKTMFESFVEDYTKYFDETNKGWNNNVRSFFKLIFMRLFFGGSPK